MKVSIDTDRCRGHGICLSTSPAVFDLNNDGYAEVLLPDPGPEHEDAVRKAALQCPERAISVST